MENHPGHNGDGLYRTLQTSSRKPKVEDPVEILGFGRARADDQEILYVTVPAAAAAKQGRR